MKNLSYTDEIFHPWKSVVSFGNFFTLKSLLQIPVGELFAESFFVDVDVCQLWNTSVDLLICFRISGELSGTVEDVDLGKNQQYNWMYTVILAGF